MEVKTSEPEMVEVLEEKVDNALKKHNLYEEQGELGSSRSEDILHETIDVVMSIERKIVSTRTASILLLIAFIAGISSAALLSQQEMPLFDPPVSESNNIAGYVYSTDGGPLSEARVSLTETGQIVTTNSDGFFLIENIPEGDYKLTVYKEGYDQQVKLITVSGEQPVTVDFKLDTRGVILLVDERRGSEGEFSTTNRTFSLIALAGSLGALMAAVMCYYERGFNLAVLGSGIGVISYGFLVSTILSLVALIFILLSKKSFGKDEEKEYPQVASVVEEEEKPEINDMD